MDMPSQQRIAQLVLCSGLLQSCHNPIISLPAIPNQDHVQIAHALHCIGLGLYKLGDLEDGLAYGKASLSMLKRLYPDPAQPTPYMRRMVRNWATVLKPDPKRKLIKLCREVLGARHLLTKELLAQHE
ncbi:MAG: hypothetical protein AAFV97_00480 [Bacteroidota bacterium]